MSAGEGHVDLGPVRYEAFVQRLILAQLNEDTEGWQETYAEFGGCLECVSHVIGQLVAIAAESLLQHDYKQEGLEPPTAAAAVARRLAQLLDFIAREDEP